MTYGHKMGTADTSGGRGRRFKSSHPDQVNQRVSEDLQPIPQAETDQLTRFAPIYSLNHTYPRNACAQRLRTDRARVSFVAWTNMRDDG